MNWHQLKTVLWLRSRLTRNQWAKSGGVGAVIAALVAVSVVLMSIGLLAGSTAVGLLALDDAEPRVFLVVWLMVTGAFLLIWLLGLITELQRSETIDLQRLMHLPVRLGQIFVVNYAASHMAAAVLLFVPTALGLTIGLTISRGPLMLLLFPLALTMVFMVTAWTYYLRGWLASLMSNPRRRRAVIMGLTTAFILVAQLPNLYFNVIRDDDSDKPLAGETQEQRTERETRETDEMFARLEWMAVGNQFGFDRDGFRAMVLAPIDRWQVLLGKNLAAFLPAAASSTVLLIVLAVWIGLPSLVIIASFLQLAVGLCLTMVAGNALSILVPYRIQPGSMKPTKMPGLAMLVMIVLQMSLPLALTPVFLPPLAGYLSGRSGGPDPAIVNALASLLLAAVMASIYWWSLGPLGRLLHRRETQILAKVSAEVE